MFSSTVIATIARPTLSRTVNSVLDQSFSADDFEIIVVNDSGRPLPEADWQRSERVRIIDTNRRERIMARNSGAAIARGRYLHFLDDDDWLLPGALQNLWMLAQRGQADWLYGGSQLVDRSGRPVLQLRHGMNGNCFVQVMSGEWIPLQSSLVRADAFFAIGGFTPLVLASQDVDLVRRIALRGDLVGTDVLVACIAMGIEGSSTDYEKAPQYSRWAREKILNEPGVFDRLRASAKSPAWLGRMARIYLTSSLWNLRRGRAFTAASRATFGLAGLLLSGKSLFAPGFWRSVARRYSSETFSKGQGA